MDSCLFCKIVKGEVPSYKFYEDDNFFAFLDVYPRTKGHTLIIPKKHYQWTYDVPNFGEYWEVALKITNAIKKSLNPHFVTYVTHGLQVPHAHIHIMPRTSEETEFVPEIISVSKEDLTELAEKIKSVLY